VDCDFTEVEKADARECQRSFIAQRNRERKISGAPRVIDSRSRLSQDGSPIFHVSPLEPTR
jgi:hypothetical protein